MDISFNGILTDCYHFIKDKLSNLTPLQRKVALVVLAYLSCATIGYFIYRYFCFRAYPISGRKARDEGEDIPFSAVHSDFGQESPISSSKNFKADHKRDFDNFLRKKVKLEEFT